MQMDLFPFRILLKRPVFKIFSNTKSTRTHKSSVNQDSMAFCQNTKISWHTLILFTAHSLGNPGRQR